MALSYEPGGGAQGPGAGADFSIVRDSQKGERPLEATLPPTPVRDLLAASGATLYVLATDSALVATVRRAAEHHPLVVVERWTELMEAVEAGRCGIALIDAALLGSRVAECITKLASQSHRLVTLVAADRSTAPEHVGFLSDGRIHRLLIKPPSVGAARLLIESATARRLQLRDGGGKDVRHAAPLADGKLASRRWAVAAAALTVALLGAALLASQSQWWELAPAGEASVGFAASAATSEAVPTLAERLADHRAGAALAVQEGRLAEPIGDNALDHYLAILALEPTDEGARAGVSAVLEALLARAEDALLAGSLETAAAALDGVRRADSASSRLALLDAQLARALTALAAPPAPRIESTPPAQADVAELDSILSLAGARLRRGQLLRPAGDSARAYLDRAAALDRDDPRVAALRTDLAAALVAAARLVFDADLAAAANLAAEARQLGTGSAELAALERDVAAARARAEQQRLDERLEAARERVQRGVLFAPAADNALDLLTALQAEAPALAGLADAWEAFRQAGVAAIQRAIDAGDWPAVDAQLAQLAAVPDGAAVAEPLAAARLQATYLARAVSAAELTLQSSVPVVYPQDALEREVEGWVDIEFVVDRTGQPRDLAVVQGSPARRFDAAALAAVAQYRYQPFERDGRVYERRVQLRVRFQIE